MDVLIRKADKNDVPALVKMCQEETRYLCQDEIYTWMQFEACNIYVAECQFNKEILGSCIGLRLSEQLGFIGLYMVRQQYRNAGIGSKLWKTAIKRVEDLNVGIRGLKQNVQYYVENYSFKFIEDYVIRYYKYAERKPLRKNIPYSSDIVTFLEGELVEVYSNNQNISYYLNDDDTFNRCEHFQDGNVHSIVSKLIDYDKSVCKRDHSFVLRQMLSWKTCKTKIAVADGKVLGYACLRQTVTGIWIVSPFYADSERVAEDLLGDLLRDFRSSTSEPIEIGVPDTNEGCQRLMEKFEFKYQDVDVYTAFTKYLNKLDISKVYAFHSNIFCCD